jgi:hypothetical protein
LPEETDSEEGNEEGIGTHVGFIAIERSLKGTNSIPYNLAIGETIFGVGRRDSHYEVETRRRWWLEVAL